MTHNSSGRRMTTHPAKPYDGELKISVGTGQFLRRESIRFNGLSRTPRSPAFFGFQHLNAVRDNDYRATPPPLYMVLSNFDPLVAEWFATRFEQATEPQIQGWPEIAAGRDVSSPPPPAPAKPSPRFSSVSTNWSAPHAPTPSPTRPTSSTSRR